MNSLYTFGCSFTAGQDMISKNNQYYQLKKRYSKLLSKAVKKKLNILCYDCKFSSKGIKLNKKIKFKIK